MKSSVIINHLLNLPKFKRLKAANEATRALRFLGRARWRLIRFIYQKDEILFVAVSSNLGLAELKSDSNINMIKYQLNAYISQNQDSALNKIKDVRFFVAREVVSEPAQIAASQPARYIERSDGEFINLAKNQLIKEAFERLRATIKANQNAK